MFVQFFNTSGVSTGDFDTYTPVGRVDGLGSYTN